jgi:hypothetical protein
MHTSICGRTPLFHRRRINGNSPQVLRIVPGTFQVSHATHAQFTSYTSILSQKHSEHQGWSAVACRSRQNISKLTRMITSVPSSRSLTSSFLSLGRAKEIPVGRRQLFTILIQRLKYTWQAWAIGLAWDEFLGPTLARDLIWDRLDLGITTWPRHLIRNSNGQRNSVQFNVGCKLQYLLTTTQVQSAFWMSSTICVQCHLLLTHSKYQCTVECTIWPKQK